MPQAGFQVCPGAGALASLAIAQAQYWMWGGRGDMPTGTMGGRGGGLRHVCVFNKSLKCFKTLYVAAWL